MAADATTRTEKFPSGILSVGLGEVERQVPLDEPPPLPPNAALTLIGKSVPRQNGRAKVTGASTARRKNRTHFCLCQAVRGLPVLVQRNGLARVRLK